MKRLIPFLSLVLGYGAAQLFGADPREPAPEKTLRIEGNRVSTLDAITRAIRAKGGVEIYVDHRWKEKKVFVSAGDYDVGGLIEALQQATGMETRKVELLHFLTFRDPTLGRQVNFPVLRDDVLSPLGELLRPIAESVDLKKEGSPWAAADFLAGKHLPFDKMSQEQQRFVTQLCVGDGQTGDAVKKGSEGGQGTRQEPALRNKRIRLGASYLIIGRVYTPSKDQTQWDPGRFHKVRQVYFDYGSALATPHDLKLGVEKEMRPSK